MSIEPVPRVTNDDVKFIIDPLNDDEEDVDKDPK